jgi:DNA-binding CsgD family transcriptional regulator
MNKLIVLIHSSEIIRKGLANILRSFFNVEIIQCENTLDLHSFIEMKNYSLVCLLEDSMQVHEEVIQILKKNNQMKLIGFFNNGTPPGFSSSAYDFSVFTDTTSLELQEIFSRCWKKKDKPVRTQENDELTNREKDVLRLVALGHSNKAIADKLFISVHTVISHRKNITDKTGIKSISGLTVYAILNNLIDTDTIDPKDLI